MAKGMDSPRGAKTWPGGKLSNAAKAASGQSSDCKIWLKLTGAFDCGKCDNAKPPIGKMAMRPKIFHRAKCAFTAVPLVR